MTDENRGPDEKTSDGHWDSLADLLGTKVDADAAQPTPAPAEPKPTPEPDETKSATSIAAASSTPANKSAAAPSMFGAGILDAKSGASEPAQDDPPPETPDTPVAAPAKSAVEGRETASKPLRPRRTASKTEKRTPVEQESGFGAGLGLSSLSAFEAVDEEPTPKKPEPAREKPTRRQDRTPRRQTESQTSDSKKPVSSQSDARKPDGQAKRGRSRRSNRSGRSDRNRGAANESTKTESRGDRSEQRSSRPKQPGRTGPTERTGTARDVAAKRETVAKPTPAPSQPAPPAAVTPPVEQAPSAPPVQPVTPKQPSHWNKIASFLGLGGSSAPATKPVVETATPEAVETKQDESSGDENAPLSESFFDAFSTDPDVVKTRATQQFVDSMFGADSSKIVDPEPSRSSELADDVDIDAANFVADPELASDDSPKESSTDEDEDRPRRGRRRRGSRGRGRGRNRSDADATTSSERPPEEDFGPESDGDEDDLGSGDSFADFVDDEDDLDVVPVGHSSQHADADERDGRRGRSRIPSWLDCVSAIVETNIENHNKKGGNDSRPRRRRRRPNGNSN